MGRLRRGVSRGNEEGSEKNKPTVFRCSLTFIVLRPNVEISRNATRSSVLLPFVQNIYIYFIVICIDNDRLNNINVVLRTERQLWLVFSALSSRRWPRARSPLLVDELARVDESIRDNVTGASVSANRRGAGPKHRD